MNHRVHVDGNLFIWSQCMVSLSCFIPRDSSSKPCYPAGIAFLVRKLLLGSCAVHCDLAQLVSFVLYLHLAFTEALVSHFCLDILLMIPRINVPSALLVKQMGLCSSSILRFAVYLCDPNERERTFFIVATFPKDPNAKCRSYISEALNR